MERAFSAVAVMVLLSACGASPKPSTTPSVPTFPSQASAPTPANPELDCEQSSKVGALNCRAALAAAIAALPPGDRPIRAVFRYGTNCADIAGCGFNPMSGRVDFGLVTFSYPGDTHWEYIYIMADASGRLHFGSRLSSSAPPLFSEPSIVAFGEELLGPSFMP